METLGQLCFGEFLQFKDILQKLQMKEFPRVRIEMAQNKVDLVELMVEICGQQSVEVTMEVLKKMNRTDLVQRLSDTSSGSKGKFCGNKTPIQFQYQTFDMQSRVLFYFEHGTLNILHFL